MGKESDDFSEKFSKAFPPSTGFSNTKNVLDEDCDRPACEDTMSALSAALKQAQAKASSSKHAVSTQQQQHQQQPRSSSSSASLPCPSTSRQLGHSSWDLLHSMAAWYPEHPSPKEETMMTQFFTSFAHFYPCTYCAEDFQRNIREHPVRTTSRQSLCLWLCEQHNLVNEKLGKPAFQCDMTILDERWRKSTDPKCQK